MILLLLFVSLTLPVEDGSGCHIDPEAVSRIRDERVTGSLEAAESEARRLLGCPDPDAGDRLGVQLELAKILDRVGLHNNARPVTESLEILRRAAADIDPHDTAARARVALALAEYHYRAEMRQREFTVATEEARKAEALFKELGDPVGETDAVHRLGLIEIQKRHLPEARELFDRSLEVSEKGPKRLIFLSDYHRHVAYVDVFEGNHAAAIPHFEKSLAYRDEAGSRDYGLFARTALGSALIDGGRPAEARPYLEEALEIARELPSPVGELRATYYTGEMHEALGEAPEARRAFLRAEELAAELGVESFRKAAREALGRLAEPR